MPRELQIRHCSLERPITNNRLRFWANPNFGERRGAGDWIQACSNWFDQSYLCNQTHIETLDTDIQWSFLVGECTEVLRTWYAQIIKRKHGILDPPRPYLMRLFICLFLNCIIYNKTATWILWVIPVNCSRWGCCVWVMGTPWTCSDICSGGSLVGDWVLNWWGLC